MDQHSPRAYFKTTQRKFWSSCENVRKVSVKSFIYNPQSCGITAS